MDFNIQGQKQFVFYLRQALMRVEHHATEFNITGDSIHEQMRDEAMQEYKQLLKAALDVLSGNATPVEMPVSVGLLYLDEVMLQQAGEEIQALERFFICNN